MAALIAGVISATLGSYYLAQGSAWPSSDLDGHIATIELYRTSLEQGVFWPYDRTAAFGCDGIAYYGWFFDIMLGFVALVLQHLGVVSSAACTVIGTILAALALLPLTASWTAAQCAGPLTDRTDRQWVHVAGALASFTFLAGFSGDGLTGIGMGTVAMGMLNQVVGWNLLLLLIGAAARTVQRTDQQLVDGAVVVSTAALLSTHTLSSLAGAIALIPFISRAPKRLLVSGLLGTCLALGSIAAVMAVSDRLAPLAPWKSLSASDPLLAVAGSVLAGQGMERFLIPAS
ncbi:MAG TPA: hypothetical protein VHX44_09230, partial [Planctomycetota bacterium]|nr:hypothetical protein [Planctomycetota bacterium]